MRTELSALSAESAVTTETLAGLSAAAQRNGEELSSFEGILRDLPKRLAETAIGTGEAKRGFDALGISVKDQNGELRQSDDVLREVITKLQAIEDPTRRAGTATQVFGAEGAKLMRVLGDTPLENFIQYATEYGVDVGPDAIRAAEQWTAAQSELRREFDRIASHMVDAIDLTEAARVHHRPSHGLHMVG